MVNITSVNLQALATSLPYITSLQAFNASTAELTFHEYSPEFSTSILGPTATWTKLHNESYQAFHEAGVYDRATKSIYISSNYAGTPDNPINVTVISLQDFSLTSKRYAGLAAPNGGRSFIGNNGKGQTTQQVLIADEGDLSSASALTLLDPSTGTMRQILNNYHGKNFSSLNDVVQHPETGDIWFTDAQYGWLQYFRPDPQLPNQVYRFEPTTGRVQAVADGFGQSNGLEFSPDLKTLYVTDTGAFLAQRGGNNATRPATIYAYDVVDRLRLSNRRTFAYIDQTAPDGIHTDVQGNVYAACGDGIRAWDSTGKLLGIMRVQGGSSNFVFVPGGIMIFNEYRLFLVSNILAKGREVDRDFGPLPP